MNGSLQKKKNSEKYYIVINDYLKTGKQKWISTGTSNKKEANKILINTLSQIDNNNYHDHSKDSFLDALMRYNLETVQPDVEETTLQGYLSIINNHIIPYFAPMNLTISDVRPVKIQNYIDAKYKQGLVTSTIRRHLSILKSFFNFIAGLEIISKNPTEFVRLHNENGNKRKKRNGKKSGDKKSSFNTYTIEELRKLMEVVHGDVIEPAVVLAGNFGLRRGELLGVRWSDIDFANKTLTIINNITGPTKEVEKYPKTEASETELPLKDDIIEYLQNLKQRQETDKIEYGNAYKDADKDYIFRYPDGRRVARATLNRRFKALLEKNSLKHIRLHDLRHTFATLLVKTTDTQTLKSLMRVSSVRTLEIYTHDTEDMTDRIKALNGLSILKDNKEGSQKLEEN